MYYILRIEENALYLIGGWTQLKDCEYWGEREHRGKPWASVLLGMDCEISVAPPGNNPQRLPVGDEYVVVVDEPTRKPRIVGPFASEGDGATWGAANAIVNENEPRWLRLPWGPTPFTDVKLRPLARDEYAALARARRNLGETKCQ